MEKGIEYLMKSNPLFQTLTIISMLLLLSGCGRKEEPRIAVDDTFKPQLIDLKHQVVGNVLELSYTLQGNPEGVGVQIDRTEMDPYCKCPGFWRRFQEDTPLARNVGVETKKLVNLKVMNKRLLFRIRAVDLDGNIGPWSKMIEASAEFLFE